MFHLQISRIPHQHKFENIWHFLSDCFEHYFMSFEWMLFMRPIHSFVHSFTRSIAIHLSLSRLSFCTPFPLQSQRQSIWFLSVSFQKARTLTHTHTNTSTHTHKAHIWNAFTMPKGSLDMHKLRASGQDATRRIHAVPAHILSCHVPWQRILAAHTHTYTHE